MESFLLSNISPLMDDVSVKVKIDRSFSREIVHYTAVRCLKEAASVDFVVYDQMGTRMMVKLVSMTAQSRFLPMVSPESVYEIMYPVVEDGGEGIHDAFHLILNEGSDLKNAWGAFPPLPMRVMTVSEVPRTFRPNAGFFDVVGFVNYCGFVHWVCADGYFEKEFQLILQSSPSDSSRPNQQVRCCLSGAWVEAVYKDIEEATKLTPHPFVLLRYLVSAQPIDGLHIFQGIPSVMSYGNASSLDVDPEIPRIQRLKEKMLSSMDESS